MLLSPALCQGVITRHNSLLSGVSYTHQRVARYKQPVSGHCESRLSEHVDIELHNTKYWPKHMEIVAKIKIIKTTQNNAMRWCVLPHSRQAVYSELWPLTHSRQC